MSFRGWFDEFDAKAWDKQFEYVETYGGKIYWISQKRNKTMERKKYTYWWDDDMWLGYLEEYTDYMTQGETIEELEENLRDIYEELSSGSIPYI